MSPVEYPGTTSSCGSSKGCYSDFMGTPMRKSFWRGLWQGLGSPTEIFGERLELEQSASATESLRSDWERIGRDFRTVIGREAPPPKDDKESAARHRSAA